MNFKSLNYNNFVIDDVLDAVKKYHKKKKCIESDRGLWQFDQETREKK